MSGQSLAVRQQAELAALEDERQWAHLMRRAELLSKSGMVQKALQGKPEDCAVVMLACQDLGLPVSVTNINSFHVIEGTPEPSSQLTVGMAHAAGYQTRWGRNDHEVAEIDIRRPGSDRWEHFVFSIDDAKRAHLLDEWVEEWASGENGRRFLKRYVLNCHAPTPCKDARGDRPQWAQKAIDRGDVKHKDNWWNWTADMLRARVAKRAVKAAAPEVRLGIIDRLHVEHSESSGNARVVIRTEELDDDGITDAELVDDEQTSAAAGEQRPAVAADVTAAETNPAAGDERAAGPPAQNAPAAGTGSVPELVPAAQAKLRLANTAMAEALDQLEARALVEQIWQRYRLTAEPVSAKTFDIVAQEVRIEARSAMGAPLTGSNEQ